MIHLYTGDGKGKTTASLGLALRAAGAGWRVVIIQFCKGRKYSELTALKNIPQIKVRQFGRRCFIRGVPLEKDVKLAQAGWGQAKEILKKGSCDMLILDELPIALHFKLLDKREVVDFLSNFSKKIKIEIVITGRNAPKELVEVADLVSEIKEIRHYYRAGIKSRRGIEF